MKVHIGKEQIKISFVDAGEDRSIIILPHADATHGIAWASNDYLRSKFGDLLLTLCIMDTGSIKSLFERVADIERKNRGNIVDKKQNWEMLSKNIEQEARAMLLVDDLILEIEQ